MTSNSLRYRSSELLQRAYDLRVASKDQIEQLKQLNRDETETDAAGREAKVLNALNAMALARRPATAKTGSPNNVQHLAGTPAKGALLLDPDSAPLMATAAGVPGLDVEIERAVMQVGRLIEKEEQEEREKAGGKGWPKTR